MNAQSAVSQPTTSILSWLQQPSATRGLRLADQSRTWRQYSWAELAARAYGVGEMLRNAGVTHGDVVSIALAEPVDFIAALGGTWLAGATASPLATAAGYQGRPQYEKYLARLLAVARPAAVLCDPVLRESVANAVSAVDHPPVVLPVDGIPPAAPDSWADPPEMALLQFTSGSTGSPKGIVISRTNLEANLAAIHDWVSFSAVDSVASWLPLYHDMGLIGSLLTPATRNADLWLLRPEQFLRDPLLWLECMGRRGVSITTAPTFGYSLAARRIPRAELAGMDFRNWRVAILGAERVDPVAAAEFAALVRPYGFRTTSLMPAYGLAEATLAVTGIRPGTASRLLQTTVDALRVGEPVPVTDGGQLGVDNPGEGVWLAACGRPLRGVEVTVRDDDGRVLPEGSVGEVTVTGHSIAAAYRGAPGGSTRFGVYDLHTGDIGFLLDGELYVIGRVGDAVKIRGRTVFAEDLEQATTNALGIDHGRCHVVLGALDDGPVVAVFLERHDGAWSDAALAALRSIVGTAARVVVYRARSGEVPRTSSGKVRRRELWQRVMTARVASPLLYTDGIEDGNRPQRSTPR